MILTAFVTAYVVRDQFLTALYGPLAPFERYLWLLLFIFPLWAFSLSFLGLYQSYRTKPWWVEPWRLGKVAILCTVLSGTFLFALKNTEISRLFLALLGTISWLLLVTERVTIRAITKQVRRKGYNVRNIVIVGTGKQARDFHKLVQNHQEWGLNVLGLIADGAVPSSGGAHAPAIIGTIDQLAPFLYEHVVDEVFFAVSQKKLQGLEETFLVCEELGIQTRVLLHFLPHLFSRVCLDELHGMPLLTFATTPRNELVLGIKRAFDLLVSLVILLCFFPFGVLLALAIKVTSAGPVLYTQTRVGLNGRKFTLYKFRSMVQDADCRKEEVLQLNEGNGPAFKLRNDPRITALGKFMRKMSLDEMPQFWNVLVGEMSIVGPRPPVPEEVQAYQPWQRRRLSMKPGLTCLWQVNGRNTIRDFEQWMKLDLQYIDNWSFGLDMKIFLKTIPIVLIGRGAS